ncbi:MAG: hypothetical protein HKP05_07735 [Woeseiaceae bacterium]|nr:hypothetical protein [Gammaproteobacteria bacterium]NNK25530.1 hypothetical protein [Woeseiaceae bacterium]
MKNLNRYKGTPWRTRLLAPMMLGLAALLAGGCESPSDSDGTLFNEVVLPTDTLLNLACAEVGVGFETCVLEDPANPYAFIPTFEFNVNDPDGPSKFELNNAIPAGPTGAKARFYLWATALARQPSGENQWYTARALHELFDANSDELIRNQALKAYQAVLQIFYGSFTVFEFGPVTLNERAADDLYRTEATGFRRLVDGDPSNVIELLLGWGFIYEPATPPLFDDGLVIPVGG